MRAHAIGRERQPEARPPGTRVILGSGAEQFLPTAHAAIDAGVLVVGVLAGERRLGAFVLRHVVLQRRKPGAQLRIIGRFSAHRDTPFPVVSSPALDISAGGRLAQRRRACQRRAWAARLTLPARTAPPPGAPADGSAGD